MSKLTVSQPCLELGLRAAAVELRDLRITQPPAELRSLIDTEAAAVRGRYADAAQIRAIPEIVKLHEILRQVGVRPRRHPPSTQKLLELAWKRGTLPEINSLVDAYNLISIQTLCSLGAHDLDRISLPIELRLFQGDEPFRPLGSADASPVRAGQFGYVDAENRVLCRLDSLQADFSKVTTDTTHVLLIIETTTAHDQQQLERAVDETRRLVERFCAGA